MRVGVAPFPPTHCLRAQPPPLPALTSAAASSRTSTPGAPTHAHHAPAHARASVPPPSGRWRGACVFWLHIFETA